MYKLLLFGQRACAPCQRMKNEIMESVEEIEADGLRFDYVSLDTDVTPQAKSQLVESYKLKSTPTAFLLYYEEGSNENKEIKRYEGYTSLDTIVSDYHDHKEWNAKPDKGTLL